MTTPDAFRDAEHIADVSGISYESVANLTEQDANVLTRENERMRKLQSAAKVAFIDRLLRDLDILIYCELSALYYMDCSVILFAIRAIVQLIFFTPKAPPFDPTRNQPFIGAIFVSNIFCMIFHNFFSRPEAGEATRGYLHGGLLIDFIGQKAPISLFRLLSLDFLVLILDFVMLGLIVERVKITGQTTPTSAETPRVQDHDSEERGVHRTRPESRSSGDGAELDETNAHVTDAHASVDEHAEHTQLLADPSENGHTPGAKNSHPLDTFSSGESVIMNLGFFDVIRDQWKYSTTTPPARTSSYIPSDQTAAFLRARFGLQVGPDGRVQRIES
ncbi:DSC4 family protein [Aspergillus novofumigatus IBT 16806]|uniref:DUF1746-domain-containing protein n=1 Tax=Aspergillus novofumigatus (strain IBT 16806) TaxID=1392255 RepID=A0A2I1C2Q8_ASPN1|nr:DUF1746-domain-containing protein [Aspergillus novofumigatus IBT 16806]PKX91871.1 DUF1746-domain-containing protein [Aspergillus novofumigatus IBT 16806]